MSDETVHLARKLNIIIINIPKRSHIKLELFNFE